MGVRVKRRGACRACASFEPPPPPPPPTPTPAPSRLRMPHRRTPPTSTRTSTAGAPMTAWATTPAQCPTTPRLWRWTSRASSRSTRATAEEAEEEEATSEGTVQVESRAGGRRSWPPHLRWNGWRQRSKYYSQVLLLILAIKRECCPMQRYLVSSGLARHAVVCFM